MCNGQGHRSWPTLGPVQPYEIPGSLPIILPYRLLTAPTSPAASWEVEFIPSVILRLAVHHK